MKISAAKTESPAFHFYSLDALRGLAALGIVLWHWQHFFFSGTRQMPFDASLQPFYSLLKPLYTDGWRAVDLFFCLSGFIFYWLYATKISSRETSPGQFFVLRFSRLYPLHFLTLLIVAAGQVLMLWRFGGFFVYPNNDLYHFTLQTLFASNWGFEHGDSFNGPVWSVSVEVFLYVIFFVTCLLNFRRWWHLLLFICGGYLLMTCGNPLLGRGMFSYFIGGVAYQIFACLVRLNPTRTIARSLYVLTGLLWIVVPLNVNHSALYHFYRSHLWFDGLNILGKDIGGIALLTFQDYSFSLLLFPLTIVTLALGETRSGHFAKRFALLGNISYSSYLLHFPLQMAFVSVALSFEIPDTLFYAPWVLILFFAILIPLSLCSYSYIERPCQTFIRTWASRHWPLSKGAPTPSKDAH